MDRDSIVLRPAKPTFDEGREFARYFDEAAGGFHRFLLGRRAAEIVAEAYTKPDNNYSFRNAIFAERAQHIVGMATGFTAEQHRRFSDRPLKQAAGFPALRTRTVRLLLAPLFRILESLDDGTFYVLAVAVDAEARGAGVGSLLLDAMEEQGRASGSSRLSLDVAFKNEGARRLYERRGMSIESEWPRIRLVPPLFVRMTKAL